MAEGSGLGPWSGCRFRVGTRECLKVQGWDQGVAEGSGLVPRSA